MLGWQGHTLKAELMSLCVKRLSGCSVAGSSSTNSPPVATCVQLHMAQRLVPAAMCANLWYSPQLELLMQTNWVPCWQRDTVFADSHSAP